MAALLPASISHAVTLKGHVLKVKNVFSNTSHNHRHKLVYDSTTAFDNNVLQTTVINLYFLIL